MPDPASASIGDTTANDQNPTRLQHHAGPACDECRQKKIKCDRSQPTCGSCRRNGLACEFSDRVKRVNHTRQLVDDFAGLSDRLASIDSATHHLTARVDAISRLLERSFEGNHPVDPLSFHTLAAAATAAAADDDDDDDGDDDLPPPSSAGTGAGDELNATSTLDAVAVDVPRLVQSATGMERYYGSFSTYALFNTARKIVENLIGQAQDAGPSLTRRPSVSDAGTNLARLAATLDPVTLPSIIQTFHSWHPVPYEEDDLAAPHQSIDLPPPFLVENALQFFFDDTHIEWPIFHSESIINAIKTQYRGGQSTPDLAWSLCLNNIILLALSGRSEVFGSTDATAGLTEKGILNSLVNTAKRGLGHAQHLMAPRLANVQALLSLALVARDYLHYSVFERSLFFAFQVATSMGLQETCARDTRSTAQESERQNVIWAIYALDKQRCFIRGTSCLIYQFDCSIDTPSYTHTQFQQCHHAQLQLTFVMEDIYRELYSPKARRRNGTQLEDAVKRCDRQLRLWCNKHRSILDATLDSWSGQFAFTRQIKCSFHACQILTHRRSGLVESQRICIDEARSYLETVQSWMYQDGIGPRKIVALRRIFNASSIIAYYEIWVQILLSSSQDPTPDLKLLVDFTKAVGFLASPDYPQSYCTRLFKSISWCTEIVLLVRESTAFLNSNPSGMQLGSYNSAGSSLPSAPWQLLSSAFHNHMPYNQDYIGDTPVRFELEPSLTMHPETSAGPAAYQSQQHDWPWTGTATPNFTSGNVTPFIDISRSSSVTELPLRHSNYAYQSMQDHTH